MRMGAGAAGTAAAGAGLLANGLSFFAQESAEDSPRITKGDIAIPRFLNALEQVEADLWTQHTELGRVQDNELSGVDGGNSLYRGALTILDPNMPQYIDDNTDEINHAAFSKAYLESKGAKVIDQRDFANLPSSRAKGARHLGLLTNLTHLTVDTSFWSCNRSVTNPDFDPGAPSVEVIPSLNVGQHTVIPRTGDDTALSFLSNNNSVSEILNLKRGDCKCSMAYSSPLT
jgi:hypothetical protein